MLKTLKKTIAFVILSFMGGFMAVLFLSWKGRGVVPDIDQAISIANTYIVFTTFIFVAFTVLLTIVGYVLAQTFSTNANAQHTDAIEKIKECISKDDEKATKVLKALISSPQVQRELASVIQEKVREELQARRADAQMTNTNATTDLQTLDDLLAYTDNRDLPHGPPRRNAPNDRAEPSPADDRHRAYRSSRAYVRRRNYTDDGGLQ